MRITFLLLAAGFLFAESPAPKIDQPRTIDSDHMQRMVANQREAYLLQKEAYIIGLEVCAEAGFNYKECSLDWKSGTVSKVVVPPTPTPSKPAK